MYEDKTLGGTNGMFATIRLCLPLLYSHIRPALYKYYRLARQQLVHYWMSSSYQVSHSTDWYGVKHSDRETVSSYVCIEETCMPTYRNIEGVYQNIDTWICYSKFTESSSRIFISAGHQNSEKKHPVVTHPAKHFSSLDSNPSQGN